MEELLKGVMDKMLAVLINRLDKIHTSIEKLAQKGSAPSTKDEGTFMRVQFTALIKKLDEVARAVQNAKPEVKARVEFGEMITAIKSIKPKEQKAIDFSSLEKKLDLLLIEARTDKQADLLEKMSELTEALRSKKFEFPKEFKIEEQQFRQLRSSGSGTTVVSGGGSRMNATQVTVANVTVTSALVEYSYTFPANTVNFLMKLRAQNALLQYSWTTGNLPTSGDGLTYMTSPQGFIRGQNDVEISGKTIYFQSSVASTVAEFEVYKL